MPVTSKLPTGGSGGKLGFNNGKFTAELNIYTQMDEPKEKNGIWVKTQNKCKNILTNQKIFEDNGTWSTPQILPGSGYNVPSTYATQYHGDLYILINNVLYSYDGNAFTAKLKVLGTYKYNDIITYNDKIYMSVDNMNDHNSLYLYNNGSISKVLTICPSSNNENYHSVLSVINNDLYIYNNTNGVGIYKYNTLSYERVGPPYIYSIGTDRDYEFEYHANYNGKIIYCNGSKDSSMYEATVSKKYITYAEKIIDIDRNYNSIATFNNEVHIFNGNTHYMYNGSTITQLDDLPLSLVNGSGCTYNNTCVYKNKLFIFENPSLNNPPSFSIYSAPEKKFDNNAIIIQKSSDHVTNNGVYKVLLSDFSGNGINDYYMGFDDVFYYGNGGFEWDDEMYYGDGTKWIRFK